MAVVHCRNTIGIVLRLYEKVSGPLGIEEHRPIGDPVELRPGRNEVDDKFWGKWTEDNKSHPLLDAKVIEAEEAKPADPSAAPAQEGASE